MSEAVKTAERILALDFTSRGFGFAVLERPRFLLDWGVARLPGLDAGAVWSRIQDPLAIYRPSALVLEDVGRNPRRTAHLCHVVERVAHEARTAGVPCTLVDAKRVREFFSREGAHTKHETATLIAQLLPSVGPHLPPKRTPWISEAESMSVFDALSMILFAMGDSVLPNKAIE